MLNIIYTYNTHNKLRALFKCLYLTKIDTHNIHTLYSHQWYETNWSRFLYINLMVFIFGNDVDELVI